MQCIAEAVWSESTCCHHCLVAPGSGKIWQGHDWWMSCWSDWNCRMRRVSGDKSFWFRVRVRETLTSEKLTTMNRLSFKGALIVNTTHHTIWLRVVSHTLTSHFMCLELTISVANAWIMFWFNASLYNDEEPQPWICRMYQNHSHSLFLAKSLEDKVSFSSTHDDNVCVHLNNTRLDLGWDKHPILRSNYLDEMAC
jgi:hypothetical protein